MQRSRLRPVHHPIREDRRRARLLPHPPRLATQTPVDPVDDGFAILVGNENGTVWTARLEPGDLTRKGTRFRFNDKPARAGQGARGGLFSVFLRERMINGELNYNFKVSAYGDFSAATIPLMLTQVRLGNDSAQVRTEWTQMPNGWRLYRKDFE